MRTIAVIRLTFALPLLASCAEAPLGDSAASEGEGEGEGAFEGEGEGEAPPDQGPGGEPDTLTAGVWDDNLNYDFFLAWLDGHDEMAGFPAIPRADRDAAHALFGSRERAAHTQLDVAIVLDTTGSMGDEIAYVRAELQAIADRISELVPNPGDIRWAVVTYKDEGDEYVTRTSNFTSGTGDAKAFLDDENASGGGDYPEANDAALEAMLQLAWRQDEDTARMAFWVGDAPHHTSRAANVTQALLVARDAGVHVYPVAASGADELTEVAMRSAAQLTGGRFLFLTDDSGVGGDHLEPTLPCYFVTLLSDAMARMAEMELTGIYREPSQDEVIRTGGDPQDGRCTLDDGQTVASF
jgi:hypothetical protein